MKKILNNLMLSCKKASELIDKKSVFKISFKEKLQLMSHTAMCDACKNYQKQSILLDKFLTKYIQSSDNSSIGHISNEKLKIKIVSLLSSNEK